LEDSVLIFFNFKTIIIFIKFPDYLEAEIDSTDPLVPGHSELFGKRLLIKNFLSKPLPPSLAKYYLPLSQFTIEEEGQRENVSWIYS